MSNPPIRSSRGYLQWLWTWLFIAQVVIARPQIVTGSTTCTDASGNTYQNGTVVNNQNRLFQVFCGTNIIQTTLRVQILPSLPLCVDACVGNPYCIGATYEKSMQKCTLKGTQNLLASILGGVTGLVGTLLSAPALIAFVLAGVIPSPSLALSTILPSISSAFSSLRSSSVSASVPGSSSLSSSTVTISRPSSQASQGSTSASVLSSTVQDSTLINSNTNTNLAGALLPSSNSLSGTSPSKTPATASTAAVSASSSQNALVAALNNALGGLIAASSSSSAFPPPISVSIATPSSVGLPAGIPSLNLGNALGNVVPSPSSIPGLAALNPLASPSLPSLSLPTSIIGGLQLPSSLPSILASALASVLAQSISAPSVSFPSLSNPVATPSLPGVSLPTSILNAPQLPSDSLVSRLGSIPGQSLISASLPMPSLLQVPLPNITPSPTGPPVEPAQLEQMISYLYNDLGIHLPRESLITLLGPAWAVATSTPTPLPSDLGTMMTPVSLPTRASSSIIAPSQTSVAQGLVPGLLSALGIGAPNALSTSGALPTSSVVSSAPQVSSAATGKPGLVGGLFSALGLGPVVAIPTPSVALPSISIPSVDLESVVPSLPGPRPTLSPPVGNDILGGVLSGLLSSLANIPVSVRCWPCRQVIRLKD
ncbi:hypothetical protein CC80DRAFT_317756 [Byssothecium circinans]|uniref:Apple domain-containing protein n=1 Tax=Byssothecium circinans TaxID=147558 RepID=A0A6A5T995_9PLEO|nr:hypothetical protein CC80DRAFT_317756 [Byssothecium circinans]